MRSVTPSAVSVAFLLLVAVAAPVQAQLPPGDYDVEEYRHAASTILCDCGCHPQSVADCACGRAAEMRAEVAGFVASGMTGEEVVERYVAENGEGIRIAPLARGFNLVAWLGPFFGLLLASFGVLFVLRRWSATHSDEARAADAAREPRDSAVEAPYRDRLERALERLE